MTATVSAAIKGVKNTRPLMRLVSRLSQQQVKDTFRKQRDPVTGASWKKLRKLTLEVRPGGGGGGKTLVSTARLMRSITQQVPVITQNKAIISTKGVKYAAIHQRGGTIRPKISKFLVIPLTQEAGSFARRSAHPARLWWSNKEAKGEHPFIFKSPQGGLFIGIDKGVDQVEVVWALVKSVKIPRRRFVGFNRASLRQIEKLTASWVRSTVQKGLKTGARA